MSSNKDTTANSQNNENPQTNGDETTIIEEYTLDKNFQNESDDLEDINEDDMDGESNEQSDNKNTNEFVVDDVNDVDDPDDMGKSINENLERIKNLSKNKFVFDNDVNDNSETVENNIDDSDVENNIDNNQFDDQQEDDNDNEDENNINEEQHSDDMENHDEYNYDESHVDDEENNNKEETLTNGRKKRGLPKTMLANQQKYLEALERQQRMISSKKDKNKNQKNGKKNKNRIEEETPKKSVVNMQPPGTRRVIVAGKVKYFPIKNEDVDENTMTNKNDPQKQEISKTDVKSAKTTTLPLKASNTKETVIPKQKETNQIENNDEIVDIPVFRKEIKQTTKQSKPLPKTRQNNMSIKNIKDSVPSKVVQAGSKNRETKNIINNKKNDNNKLSKILHDNDETTEPTKKLPSSLAKKMQIHKTVMAKQIPKINKNKMGSNSGKKIPSKYAKQIENDVKKQTVKNVKNFSDLRRIKALQDINPDIDIDANKASIIELRKLRIEQRKKEQAELKKRAEANKRDSAIQDILRNDKMSKFAKTVAIKNLSVNSRNRRIMGRQKNAEN